MVSFGTIIGLGAAAAAAIGLYAVWQNRSAIGGALSRGTQVSVVNPLGSYFENLFRDSENNPESEQEPIQEPPGNPVDDPNNTFIPCSNNPADYRTWCNGYVPPPDQDFLPPDHNEPRTEPEPEAPAPEPPAEPEPQLSAAQQAAINAAALRLQNVAEPGREQILEAAEALAESEDITLPEAVDQALINVAYYPQDRPGARIYDVYLNGELQFNEYPLSEDARQYYLNEGFSVRPADGI